MAKCKVTIAEPLRQLARGKHTIAGTGDTVGEVCANLAREYPEVLRALFRENGRLRNGVTVFLNGADIKFGGGLEAKVNEGDTLSLHAPMLV